MNARALHEAAAVPATSRWLLSAAVIVGVHAAAVAAAMAYYTQTPPPGEPLAAIMVDMAPVTASPQQSQLDLAPGPEMQETEAPQPEPEPEPEQHATAAPEIAPTPPQPTPEVPLPPEAKPEPAAEKPEPVKVERPEPVKPKREPPKRRDRVAKLHPSERPPAPRTSAPLRADRRAADATAALAGARAAAVLPSYRQRLAAHLQRFKRYPSEARASGVQGTATLSFTVGRGGQVLSARLARSSGHSALDAETLAMVHRAQPLPPFPPEITQASLNFNVPVNFSVR
ncbi:outer membrane transport energization protein TonB [Rhodopseudomonas thermotolerans]|uniref:Outer membrane transport energization protein TonB n=2 Tax=Rhodopseudomonas TaxID=1073 RepID=A0A336JNK5_9BRAD|nr:MULTISPECIES: energy transducer TonB [Rhodopseudomonas]RED34443.1 outer membrane transport energization protein TonB [Rhodopseudomonas pentothenatexigens]REG02639.1 outer membrane transport energization protein TonB [Rhodopseudomonas thermotolerans]SSW91112.1 outer membrane transport energization protein TonB [Rhodopseudomonas pentothenatexigens]